jgi:hypothetical protein
MLEAPLASAAGAGLHGREYQLGPQRDDKRRYPSPWRMSNRGVLARTCQMVRYRSPTAQFYRNSKFMPNLGRDNHFARPCALAVRAMPPRPAWTSSPYRIGIAVVFHRPACITEARSMLSASISCVAPTRIECPLTCRISSSVIPTNSATRLNVCAMASTWSRGPILPRPINLRNTAPDLIPDTLSQPCRYSTVSGDKYARLPSPAWSVFERRMMTLYYTAQIFLFGAEFTACLGGVDREGRSDPAVPARRSRREPS